MMTCIIIEDEIPAQKILRNYIAKLPQLELLEVFSSAVEANSYLGNHDVDLLFLDINLPAISGIEFIRTVKDPPAIIMTTAYPDYAVSSFELDTIVDYLVKPFSFDRFMKATNKAKERLDRPMQSSDEHSEEFFFLNVDKTLHKIVIPEIVYLESDRNYITVVTTQQRLSYIDSLKNWKSKLSDDQFLQVHKSFIINRNFVDKISGNEIYVQGQRIPIGRTYKQELLKQLKII